MEATLGTIEHYSNGDETKISAGLRRWISELFGCHHKEMSRPFSRQGESYRVCIGCGAQRQFDPNAWNTGGPFYFKPARTSDLSNVQVSSLRAIAG